MNTNSNKTAMFPPIHEIITKNFKSWPNLNMNVNLTYNIRIDKCSGIQCIQTLRTPYSGYGLRENRGPICYNCEHQTAPDDCGQITMCGLNQV